MMAGRIDMQYCTLMQPNWNINAKLTVLVKFVKIFVVSTFASQKKYKYLF